jgi:hypothetical protein
MIAHSGAVYLVIHCTIACSPKSNPPPQIDYNTTIGFDCLKLLDTSAVIDFRRIESLGAVASLTVWIRLGSFRRGDPRNCTPRSIPCRQTTRHLASRPSSSIMSSKVSGISIEFSTRRRAPDDERSRTTQDVVHCRPWKAAMADFRTLRRAHCRFSHGSTFPSFLGLR